MERGATQVPRGVRPREAADEAPAAVGSASAWDRAVSPSRDGHFRPDVEGLRAVAILAVLLYHVGLPGFAGGFVGVDVFFVISGFLISGLLLRELRAEGRIALVAFYARRARRLLPMALLVIVATLALAAITLSSLELRDVAVDGAAASAYVANYRFALLATDYLAADVPPSPLLHYWSLGVEEQFYLFWPLLMLAGWRLLGARWIGGLLAVVMVTSFALSVVATDVAPPWAFFSLPTRAWQLALGGLLAVGVSAVPGRWPAWAASIAGVGGIALIAAAVIAIGETTPYPGLLSALPAAGAALVILAGESQGSIVARILGGAGPRWLGRISYSLYLWHWPLLVLVPQLLGRDDLELRVLIGAGSIGLAALTTRFVEAPFRVGGAARERVGRTVAAALVLSVFVSAGSLVYGQLAIGRLVAPPASPATGVLTPAPSVSPTRRAAPSLSPSGGSATVTPASAPPSVMPSAPALPAPLTSGALPVSLRPSLLDARDDVAASLLDGCQVSYVGVEPRRGGCVYGQTDAETSVVVLGDSHAAQWQPAIERLADERAWRVVMMTKGECPAADVTVWLGRFARGYRECDQWREAALERIEDLQPDYVLVSMSRAYAMVLDEGVVPIYRRPADWTAALARVLARVATTGATVVLIADTPRPGATPANCLAASGRVEACPAPRTQFVDDEHQLREAAAAQTAGAVFFSATDWMCDESVCPLIFGDVLVYRDGNHITATFAVEMAPMLDWVLQQQAP